MSPEVLKGCEPGTKLIVSDSFTNGEDEVIRHLLGSVVTLERYDGFQWLYVEGYPDNALHVNEIVSVYPRACLDDEDVSYETDNIMSLIGGT